jgi:hypothetical protein
MAARFYDPEGKRYGIPTWPYRLAPEGYETKEQLRRRGLVPGPQPVAGQLMWMSRKARRKGGIRTASLYLADLARPVGAMTPGRWRSHAAAMRARRTCPECRVDRGYVIPTSLGACVPCLDGPSIAVTAAAA